ncbi:hypothetical protein [Streptomyces sp. NPDC020362]|uniref:hypothetical protein n=1 Tax=Streptomyces sp. NPDC020362 TaxID=3154486 RepID=UPI0033E21028
MARTRSSSWPASGAGAGPERGARLAPVLSVRHFLRVRPDRGERPVVEGCGNTQVISPCRKTYTGFSREAERDGARYCRCSGNAPRDLSQKSCGCSCIDTDVLEGHVRKKVMEIASDSGKLQELAEWIGAADGNRSGAG